MVVQEGSGWVLRQEGTRKNLTAASVVIWEPGEWVEYGSYGGEGCHTESSRAGYAGVRPKSPRCTGSTLTRLCAAISR